VQIKQDISDAVIRFHVIANSDSLEDQVVKYKVRDRILAGVQQVMESAETKEEAQQLLERQLDTIVELADKVLEEEGMEYRTTAGFEHTNFPEKSYGDLTFPKGDYDAVRILLGDGKGQNWWCVMFPTLCLVEGTCEEVPETSKEKLKEALGEDEFQLLTKEKGDLQVEYRVRIPKWLKKWLERI